MQTFNSLSEQFFSQIYFRFSPTAGTSAGLHQYDSKLEDYSAEGVAAEVAALHQFETKLETIDPSALARTFGVAWPGSNPGMGEESR